MVRRRRDVLVGVEVVELWFDESLAAQHVLLEPIWRNLGDLVVLVRARGHGEDIVQFFEGSLFRLGEPQKDHDKGNRVQSGVESKRPLWRHGLEHSRECQGQYRGPEVVGRHCPRHAYLTVGQREDFCRIRKGHRAFSRRVEDVEEVDEQRDETQMSVTALWDPEAEPSCQKCPTHVGKGEE